MSDNLAKFLARAYTSHSDLRWRLLEMDTLEEIKEALIMNFVTIQGMKEQGAIRRIGEMSIDNDAIHGELMALLNQQEKTDE